MIRLFFRALGAAAELASLPQRVRNLEQLAVQEHALLRELHVRGPAVYGTDWEERFARSVKESFGG